MRKPLKSAWYRPDYLKVALSNSEIKAREIAYGVWYRAKFQRAWKRPQEEPEIQPILTTTILKPEKVIRGPNGQVIRLRHTLPGTYGDFYDDMSQVPATGIKMRPCAPALYIVILGNYRIDSFLKLENAKKCIERLLAA